MTYFFDFYFDSAHSLIPRVKSHFSFVHTYFKKINIITLDDRNFTQIFRAAEVTHIPLLPVRVPHVIRGLLGTILGIIKLTRVSKAEGEIVLFSSPYALYSIIVSRLLKIPLIVHFKYDPTMQPLTNLKRRLIRGVLELMIRMALRSAKLVVVTTPRLKEMVINRGVRPENVIVSPNYVDEKLFSPDVDEKRVRQQLSIPSHEKMIIYMGRLSYEKGVDVLVKAFSIIQNDVYNAKLVIVGDGPEKDKLKEDCQKLNVHEKVIFIKSVAHNLVPNFLAASDIVVLPSYSEGHPKFLIEAMIMGKPIVATNVPGITDVVTHLKEAVLVEAGDANALAKAIELLLKDEELAHNLAYNARKKALEMYSKSSVFKRFKETPLLILGF